MKSLGHPWMNSAGLGAIRQRCRVRSLIVRLRVLGGEVADGHRAL